MHVLIIGAGPSGLLLSLLLVRTAPPDFPITVTLLEQSHTLDDRPRAAHFATSAVRVLSAAGVLEDVRKEGFIPRNASLRKKNGHLITKFEDFGQSCNPDALAVLPLNQLGLVLMRHVEQKEGIEVRWNAKVLDVGTDGEKAWCALDDGNGKHAKLTGHFLVGCDGGNSTVRRCLFGEGNFEGKTWEAQIVATNVYYPLDQYGYDDINYIFDPVDYHMAVKITTDGLWRVTYGESIHLTTSEIIANQPVKYERMLPGNPKPEDYNLLDIGSCRIHQRCADSFRVGRVLLAADAAHLCNPFGGLGLTGGIADVGGLAECLTGIAAGTASESILDKYDEIRRAIWKNVIDPISSSNFRRISATDAENALEADDFLAMAEKTRTDTEVRKGSDQSTYGICHDFKQYYNKENARDMRKDSKFEDGL